MHKFARCYFVSSAVALVGIFSSQAFAANYDCGSVSAATARVITQLNNAGYGVGCGKVSFPSDPVSSCTAGGTNSPNPSTCYGVYEIPGRSGSTPGSTYQLDNDEAVVFMGTTPPESFYYGFQSYVYSRANPLVSPVGSDYINVFASVGPAWNQRTIMGETVRSASLSQVFSDTSVVLTTANPQTQNDIVDLALPYLFNATPTAEDLTLAQQITNLEMLPVDLVQLGSTGPTDKIQTLLRLTPYKTANGDFAQNSVNYMAASPAVVLRVSPLTPRFSPPASNLYTSAQDPLPPTKVEAGVVWEQNLLTQAGVGNGNAALTTIANNVIASEAKSGFALTENLPPGKGMAQWPLDGRICLADFEANVATGSAAKVDATPHCAGDSSDANYVVTAVPSLEIPTGGLIVIVGVNHGTLGSGTYSNFAIEDPGTSAAARTNAGLRGSAADYLAGSGVPTSAAGDFYVLSLQASCSDVACLSAPDTTVLEVAERNYLAPMTGTKPDPTDVLLPTVLIFSPSSN